VLDTNVGPTKSIPADGVIQISFDRYLLPSTILRQSYVILDTQNKPIPTEPLQTIYDPVARTVTIAGPNGPGRPWLTPNQAYKLVLGVPEGESDLGGFRAIDRAPLNANQTLEFPFMTGPEAKETQIEPIVSFCSDVFPILVLKCGTTSTCHASGAKAAASLILDTSEGVRNTARGRVAQGANTSARGGIVEPAGRVFGINMPLIDPNNPGNSWLVYKIDLARLPRVDGGAPEPFVFLGAPEGGPPPTIPAFPFDSYVCQVPSGAPIPPARTERPYSALVRVQPEADEIEREILNDYVLGREMPYPPSGAAAGYLDLPLTFQERERIRLWIAQGAPISECGGCRPQGALLTDAGASDQ
jgi:hypothetical protein